MNTRITKSLLSAAVLCGAFTAGGFAWQNAASPSKPADKPQQAPPPGAHGMGPLPDMIGAIKNAPGCLGVELAQTMSGKRVIFSWFEDKKSVINWYYSEPHQQMMDAFFNETSANFKPLEHVPDDAGPLLVIASLTMAEGEKLKESTMPISQIAIEIYEPVTGGLFLGGRFAPEGVKVEHMQDYSTAAKP